ncbi:unnamed protein product [Chrysoparadoxa australica]
MSSVSDFKKRKQIETARQNGQIAPETDTETGSMINPHNPEFITKRPWYLGDSGPSLKHHSKQKVDSKLSMKDADSLIQRKWSLNKTKAKAFRAGACRNCGAMGHKTNQCVERPRSSKQAAWKSGLDIAADDVSLDLTQYGKVTYDAKRDRWLGYHPDQHKEVIKRFEKIDEERRVTREKEREEHAKKKKERKAMIRAAKEKAKAKGSGSDGSDSDSDSDSDAESDDDSENDKDEFVEKEEEQVDFQGRIARQGGLGGAQMATTVRNLRIREDRAKYLYNLDPNSAYYDPKTRSMRDNPNPSANPHEQEFAGDNFIRYGGDVGEFAKTQLFAWEAETRGGQLHPVADPSQAELLHKQFETNKSKLKDDQKSRILNKYGGEKHMDKPDARLLLGQSEGYTEYDRTGRVIKGALKAPAKSKYEEDVWPGNHKSIWGSFYNKGSRQWGYACCHSLTRNSYCTGAAGIEANDQAAQALANLASDPTLIERQMLAAKPATERDNTAAHMKRSDVYGENLAPELDEGKLKEAIKKEKDFQAGKGDKGSSSKGGKAGKRKYNSMTSTDVTQEDMEAYRMLKKKGDDPMDSIPSDRLIDE